MIIRVDHSSVFPQVYDDLPVVGDLSGVRVDDDDFLAITSRLNKAKKIKKKKVTTLKHKVKEHVSK